MKRFFLKGLTVVAFTMVAGYNVYQSDLETEGMSELMLANVEALASGETGSSMDWDCWSAQKPGYGYYRCGNPCVWVPSFAGDGNSSKCFK